MRETLFDFASNELYKHVSKLGDRLNHIRDIMGWESFRPILSSLYDNRTEKGGRPNVDEVVMLKVLVLQNWYNLSDPEMEFQLADRLSFQHFIDSTEIPDFSTIWRFRERLNKSGVWGEVWNELQRQLKSKGLKIREGHIQDATFIESDLGKKRYSKEKKAEKEGRKVEYTEKQQSHMDKDASFSIKSGQVHHGYKLSTKVDVDHELIRAFETVTASQHDATIEQIDEGDIAAYRDKGYFGTLLPDSVKDFTMDRAVRNRPLTEQQKERNRKISKIRSPGERPFSVIKTVFNRFKTRYKRIGRVNIQSMMSCFAYNLYQLFTLKKKGVVA
jgi:Transposase and inactivated derivatives, IS5 family